MPDQVFLHAETGRKAGGQFKPHKTHRNGLSADFMVPVLDASGTSVELPSSVLDKRGDDLELDADGRLGDPEFRVFGPSGFQATAIPGQDRRPTVLLTPRIRRLETEMGRFLRLKKIASVRNGGFDIEFLARKQ